LLYNNKMNTKVKVEIPSDCVKCTRCGKVKHISSFIKILEDESQKKMFSCKECRIKYIQEKLRKEKEKAENENDIKEST
jgi:hypothetical protein